MLEDPDSNVFHKALPWDGGLLTIGGSQALLRTWRFADGKWIAETRWNPKFGGKFDRLRDIERGDVDGDGKDELVIATHDQGVIAIVVPEPLNSIVRAALGMGELHDLWHAGAERGPWDVVEIDTTTLTPVTWRGVAIDG